MDGEPASKTNTPIVLGGIKSDDEEKQVKEISLWMKEQGLPAGTMSFDFSDPETGQQRAIFDLAWPNGIQTGLSQPVVLLIDEKAELVAMASQAGYRCFLSVDDLRQHVLSEILAEQTAA